MKINILAGCQIHIAMKTRIFLIMLLPLLLSLTHDKPAYIIYRSDGKKISYDKMLRELLKHDVIFFGELHNDPVGHWLQLELAKSIYSVKGSALKIGAEMFEADNQVLMEEYLKGLVKESNFETEARLWNNYKTDYKPLLTFARDNGLSYTATNIPRRYAAMVTTGGFEALGKLSEQAKTWIAPLPIEYDPELKCYKDMLTMGGGPMGGRTGDNLPRAQAIKDATMAWFIGSAIGEGDIFLHLNGSYHSNRHEGIVWYLGKYKPGLKIAVINLVLEEDPLKLSEENRDSADFIIAVPATMTRTY